ncbi:MAG: PspA/IM30 family protein [Planctomycetaceae bacterium]
MAWLEKFTFIMRSNITTIRERIEDPERMLNQLIIDMEEELERVRASVAGAIADEIQLGRRAQQAREEANDWLSRATAALKRGDEENSRSALDQKVTASQRAESLQAEYEKQKVETAKLQFAVRDLEEKVRQARQKRTLLLARMARAESSQRINRAIDRAHSRSAFAQFSRLEERVERAEAMGEAYDRLEGRDPDAAELERKFEETDRQERLAAEFAQLKQRVAGGAEEA